MKGIRLHRGGKFTATIWYNKQSEYIGSYTTEKEAEYALIERVKELRNKGVLFADRIENKYVDSTELYKEIVISKAFGSLTPRALLILMLMTKKVGTKFRYNDENDRQDTTQNSYLTILKYWRNFDEDVYDNAFAYYTELIKRAYALEWKRLNKHRGHISIEGTYEKGRLNI